MNFDSYTDRGVEAAAELVNRLAPGWDRGRQQTLPTESGPRRRLAATVELAIWGRSGQLSGADAEGLFTLAQELMVVFHAASEGAEDLAAPMINALLREYEAAPQLAQHDGEPWHLHFHSQAQEAGRSRARGATCATALAIVIGSHGTGRLGVCRADRCDRVFIDTSRNGSRRFCSPSCLSRQKVAAYRARHTNPASPAEVVATGSMAVPQVRLSASGGSLPGGELN
jgi:predicted RNA-binding Zn ribbon-like protein